MKLFTLIIIVLCALGLGAIAWLGFNDFSPEPQEITIELDTDSILQ